MSPGTNTTYSSRIAIALMTILSVFVISIWPFKAVLQSENKKSDCTALDKVSHRLVKVDCENPVNTTSVLSVKSRGETSRDVNKVVFSFQPVPVNHASDRLLQTVKGVGPSLARDIITYRELYGAFDSAEALQTIPGVGEKKARYLATQFTFD
ncbi:helix-hairpin-helix domain-containing protein [Desulforhopalus sp. IMCC35007]|uniref:ComEA family DNA-binding protein n=1 Tax=Desulforhopalus sp. IMCC35007 TaxID=2569543 RepID=UPI0010AEE94E|nr:helix-hairpin-helix domain-containing protein [Desulforhopalus sp. IMCC35007]TKB11134.1 helix-hairpin-helix domain-containing protein [Desulforhopalus sp. IMCC35007]